MRPVPVAILGVRLVAGCASGGPRVLSSRVQAFTWSRADGEFTATTELLAAHGSLWAASYPAGVVHFDPETGAVTAEIGVGDEPIEWIEFAAADGGVWLLTHRAEESHLVGVWRLDPATNEATQVCEVSYVSGFAFADGALWTFGSPDPDSTGALVRLDPATCELSGDAREGSLHVLAGEGAVWGIGGENAVSRLDPSTGETTPILPADEDTVPTAAAVGAGAVWLGLADLTGDDHKLLRIDISTGAADELDIAAHVDAVAVEGEDVWALVGPTGGDLLLVRLDPVTGAELDRVLPRSAPDLVVLDGEPWLASGDDFLRVPVAAAAE